MVGATTPGLPLQGFGAGTGALPIEKIIVLMITELVF